MSWESAGEFRANPNDLITPADLCPKCEQLNFQQICLMGVAAGVELQAQVAMLNSQGWKRFENHAGMYWPCPACSTNAVSAGDTAKQPLADELKEPA